MRQILAIRLPIMVVGRNKVNCSPPPESERGFTLVEILIAIFIFAIVISSVYGSYRATFHIVHGSEFQLKIANNARVVMERLAEDLGSIVTGPEGVIHGESHKYADSLGDSLSFVSSAHLVLRKTDSFFGRFMIQYLPELNMETGFLDLYRLETVLLPGVEIEGEKALKHLICRGLQEFRITYLDRDGNETEEWLVEEGDSKGGRAALEKSPFPALVYVELKFSESMESESSTVFKTAVALP